MPKLTDILEEQEVIEEEEAQQAEISYFDDDMFDQAFGEEEVGEESKVLNLEGKFITAKAAEEGMVVIPIQYRFRPEAWSKENLKAMPRKEAQAILLQMVSDVVSAPTVVKTSFDTKAVQEYNDKLPDGAQRIVANPSFRNSKDDEISWLAEKDTSWLAENCIAGRNPINDYKGVKPTRFKTTRVKTLIVIDEVGALRRIQVEDSVKFSIDDRLKITTYDDGSTMPDDTTEFFGKPMMLKKSAHVYTLQFLPNENKVTEAQRQRADKGLASQNGKVNYKDDWTFGYPRNHPLRKALMAFMGLASIFQKES